MRNLITILLVIICQVIICQVSFGQVYQIMPQYGYSAPRFNTDSTLQLPTFNGVPTLKSNKTNKGAIAIDSTNGRFYFYNPKTSAWSQVSGGGGSTDTTSLSNRINLKLNISDTSNMLSTYLRKIDTTAMLVPYLRKVDTTNKYVSNVTKLNDSTITIFKGSTQTNITLTPSTTVASATRLITQVYNNSGTTIAKGSVIFINGRHSSNLPTIGLAQANSEDNSYTTFALVQDDIATSNSGVVIQAGNITNLNLPTSTYTDGQVVYLSPTVAGGITTTKPLAPNHIVKIGTITRAHSTFGTIELKIENGWQLDELSDVQLSTVPADSTLLFFTRTDSLWKAVTPLNAIGNRYLKPSDSTIYYSKYRSDTSRTNIYSGINGKLAKSDTSSLSTRIDSKLSKVDTSTLSSRIDLKMDKSMASYTFMANNTTATANATAQTFKDSGLKVYNGTITFTPVAPSGATNNTYRWSQIGKLVTVRINLLYATASGATLSQLVASLPSDCPAPEIPTGFSGANTTICPAFGYLFTSSTASPTTLAATIGFLRSNSGNNGYEIVLIRAGGSVAAAYITLTYFAQ